MALYFHNSFSDTVWIAFTYYDPGCSPSPWKKTGWWQVNTGDTLNAWNTDLRYVNRYASFYAEEFKDAGGATWNGTGNSWYLISDGAFDQCYDDNTNCNQQPDFIDLDFGGFADMTVTLGPEAGQLGVQGSTPLPPQLDWDWYPIVFGSGIAVGGSSHLTLRQNGTYTFSGHFHDSTRLVDYSMALVWGVKDSENKLYTFEHQGRASFPSDDNWQIDAQNDTIAQHWANIVAADWGTARANASGDLSVLDNEIIGIAGIVLGVIGIVVA